ncbi:MAG: glycoside hydrolase family 31 protein [Acetatifactor sp.]|nr:glycoside hydrolase family 31 protein [Acetatifactor sp.]
MKESLNITTFPLADDAAIVQDGNYRITVLTDRLLRLEYSKEGVFENHSTQTVLNRNFSVPEFTSEKTEKGLSVTTKYLKLAYDGKAFSKKGLTIEVTDDKTGKTGKWHYGKSGAEGGNLFGTIRTLDDVEGSCKISDGLMSLEGWGVLDDSHSLTIMEDGWVALRQHQEEDIYFFGYGSDFLGCLKDFYKLTGKTPMLPRFALGNWWSRYYEYSEERYKALMNRFEAENIPFSVAVIDMDWHLVDIDPKYGGGWTGFTWNRELFPDPEGFLKWLHDRGMRTTLNLHPADGIRGFEECYKPIAERMGVDIEKEEPVEFDATNPKFIESYLDCVCHPQEEMGVDFWWIDWQQGTKTKMDGLDPLWILNHFHYLDSGRDNKRPLTFSRYAGPGSHRYPIGFSGDTVITWESLQFQPYFTSTASNIGYGWWSHDIGGHTRGYKDDELEGRWYQYGVFSPIMRLHSEKNEFNGKEPWRFKKEIQEVMKDFLRLRHRLMPYLYTMNYRAYKDDEPIVQPMYYRNSWTDDFRKVPNEYYFGSELIVNPITTKRIEGINKAKVATWLPEGTYYDFFTDMVYSGGRMLDIYRGIETMPVFVRQGSIIPMTDRIDTKEIIQNPTDITLRVYAGADGAFTLYEDDNESMNYQKGEAVFTELSLDWAKKSFKIAAAKGNTGLIPNLRNYCVEFHGLCTEKPQEVVACAQGKEIPVTWVYDLNRKILKLTMEECNVTEDIIVTLPSDSARKQNDVKQLVFDFLNQAEMGFGLKKDIFRLFEEHKTVEEIQKELKKMDLQPDLYGAIYEIMMA